MAMTRAQHRKQLQQGLNTVFGLEYKRYPEEWKNCFTIESSSKAYEEDVLNVGFGAAQVKQEGAGISYDQGGESYVSRYTHETIALAFAITEEAEEDNLYASVGARYAKALARSMQHTKEVKGANVFNNGFSSSFPGGDGKALFATDHPLWGGGTGSNTFATQADLSETSLEEAIIQISGFTDDRGLKIAAREQKLIIPRELKFTAQKILKTEYKTSSAENDINVISTQGYVTGGWAENHYLTDPDAWFLSTDVPDGLKHFARVKLQRGMEGDFETGNMRYKARERYVFGWSDWRGAFGSSGI